MANINVTKKEGVVLESGIKIQNIEIRPVHRTKSDIQDWRNAHQHAEAINGTRIALYDLYNDGLLDAFLKRMVEKRVLGVTKNKLKYIDQSGKEIKQENSILNLLQFRLLREAIQLSKAWGIAVIELINEDGKLKIFDVPKKHICPKEGKILYDQYGTDGILYRNTPYKIGRASCRERVSVLV